MGMHAFHLVTQFSQSLLKKGELYILYKATTTLHTHTFLNTVWAPVERNKLHEVHHSSPKSNVHTGMPIKQLNTAADSTNKQTSASPPQGACLCILYGRAASRTVSYLASGCHTTGQQKFCSPLQTWRFSLFGNYLENIWHDIIRIYPLLLGARDAGCHSVCTSMLKTKRATNTLSATLCYAVL